MSNETLPDALNNFATALTQSTQSTQDLSSAVLASEAARKKRTILLALATVAILIMIVLNLGVAFAARSTQDRIQDCTDPTGECAKRGQASTAKAVGNIAQADLTMAWLVNRCALGDPTTAKYDACVDDTLDALKAGTLKSPQLPK
jgi:hypothetical protein